MLTFRDRLQITKTFLNRERGVLLVAYPSTLTFALIANQVLSSMQGLATPYRPAIAVVTAMFDLSPIVIAWVLAKRAINDIETQYKEEHLVASSDLISHWTIALAYSWYFVFAGIISFTDPQSDVVTFMGVFVLSILVGVILTSFIGWIVIAQVRSRHLSRYFQVIDLVAMVILGIVSWGAAVVVSKDPHQSWSGCLLLSGAVSFIGIISRIMFVLFSKL